MAEIVASMFALTRIVIRNGTSGTMITYRGSVAMIDDVRSGTIATGTKTMQVIPTAIEAITTNGSTGIRNRLEAISIQTGGAAFTPANGTCAMRQTGEHLEKENRNALDTGSYTYCDVVARNDHVVHDERFHPHPVGSGDRHRTGSRDPGPTAVDMIAAGGTCRKLIRTA